MIPEFVPRMGGSPLYGGAEHIVLRADGLVFGGIAPNRLRTGVNGINMGGQLVRFAQEHSKSAGLVTTNPDVSKTDDWKLWQDVNRKFGDKPTARALAALVVGCEGREDAMYVHALEAMSVDPEKTLVVDPTREGALAAKKLGMVVVGVHSPSLPKDLADRMGILHADNGLDAVQRAILGQMKRSAGRR